MLSRVRFSLWPVLARVGGGAVGELVNAAVVFTDLVGSTALASRVGPEVAQELRVEHFSLLRAVVGRHGGREVKNLGDGLMVVFERSSEAVAAATEMQQLVERGNRSVVDGEPLVIRVGVAVGEADTDEDGDLFGPPVVEAARLCAAAGDGQVLASEVVRALIGGRGGFEFRSLGVRELKGFPDPVPVCEVGWEPLPEEGDGAPMAVPLPARLAPTSGPFAGRVAEVELLGVGWKAVLVGQRRAVVVAGEAGIGKTTLVSRFAAQVHADGAVVAYGRCDEDFGVAYQPWIEALGHLVCHLSEEVLAAHVIACGGPLTRLVPELGRRVEVPVLSSSVDAESDRYLLFGAVVDLLGRAAGVGSLLVVLDDLHWADRSSVQLLRHVVSDPVLAGVLVIATYRQTDVSAGHPLVGAIAALRRVEGVGFVDLGGLNDLELLTLLETIAGNELPENGLVLRDALVAETDGNPFFTLEILRHLVESGLLRQDDEGRWAAPADLRETGLPVSVRQVVGQRVANLGKPVERVLRQAAVIGRDFDLDLLVAVTDTDPDTLLDLLDSAVEAAVVLNVEGDRFSFAHALIEHALYQDLAPARRTRAHRRIAEALEAHCGDDPGKRVGELAHHWAAAVAPADAQKAVEWARRAGDHALDQLAPAEAMRWYHDALGLLDEAALTERTGLEIRIGLGEAQKLALDPAYPDTLLAAARDALARHENELGVRAALARNRGTHSMSGDADDEYLSLLRRALEVAETGDTPQRARLLSVLAAELTFDAGTTPEERIALVDDAIGIARRTHDDALLADVVPRCHLPRVVPETVPDCWRDENDAVLAADRTGDPVLMFRARWARAFTAAELGDRDTFDDDVRVGAEIAARLGVPLHTWMSSVHEATSTGLEGDPDTARAAARHLLELGAESGIADFFTVAAVQLNNGEWLAGKLAPSIAMIDEGRRQYPGVPLYETALAFAHAWDGDPEIASGLLEDAFEQGFPAPRNFTWLGDQAWWAECAYRIRHPPSATLLCERLEPWTDRFVQAGTTVVLSVSHYAGLARATMGDLDRAVTHLERAVEMHRAFRAPFFIACSEIALAEVLLERSTDSDRQRSRTLATSNLTLARQRGYPYLERDAQAVLERLG